MNLRTGLIEQFIDGALAAGLSVELTAGRAEARINVIGESGDFIDIEIRRFGVSDPAAALVELCDMALLLLPAVSALREREHERELEEIGITE